MYTPLPTPPTYDNLELDQFEPGKTHFARVILAEDAVSRLIAVPVLIHRAKNPGPVVGITAAIHGNELNGIPTIHRLFDPVGPLMQLTRGTVVAVPILNIPGYIRYQRTFHDGQDLNRIMPGRADGNCGQVYANRILNRLVRHFNILIDLHTASFGRINTLYVRVDTTRKESLAMARALRPQIIVHNAGGDGTLRAAAVAMGLHSITVEIGDPQRLQPGLVRASRLGLQEVLEYFEMLPDMEDPDPRETVECVSSYWIYTDTGGLLEVFPSLMARVKKGEVVARLSDPWGRIVATYTVPDDGIVVGKSTNPVAHTGARILHIGIIGDFD